MISVDQARELILSKTVTLAAVVSSTEDAAGQYLAADVMSPHPLPFFSNSAMDGYAVVSSDTAMASEDAPLRLKMASVIPAGADPVQEVGAGQTAQILTGAMIPPGADAVVRQEDVTVEGEAVVLRRPVRAGENIRRGGEEVKAGDVLLRAGTRLTPAAIGALLGAGVAEVEVYAQPKVGIITTGSELLNAGEVLQPGKIYNSNGATLSAAVKQAGAAVAFEMHVTDDQEALTRSLAGGIAACDVLLVTGGVSVGRFDYVKESAAAVGIEPVFWRVKQKPGKPLYFGTGSGRYMFGLPGNPASALVCFYEYVYPCLRKCMGATTSTLRSMTMRLEQPVRKKAGLTHFLKGVVQGSCGVEVLERQGSHMMTSFAMADCLVVIPEEVEELKKGDEVQVHLLPGL